MNRRFFVSLLFLSALCSSLYGETTGGDKKPKAGLPKDTAVVPAVKKEELQFKAISEVTKKCKKMDGLFPMYQDTTNGKTYIEISEDKLGKDFIYFRYIMDGVPVSSYQRGGYRDGKLIRVTRYFDKIEFTIRNTSFYYDPQNALSKAADANISNAIVLSQTISGLSQDTGMIKTKHFLLDADKLFLQENLAQIKPSARQGENAYSNFNLGKINADKTKYLSINNYPENTDVVVEYVFENQYPTFSGGEEVTDARAVSVKMQHSFIELPNNDFKPRFEDPRVGYNSTLVTDMTTTSVTPFRDMIRRWDLVKKNKDAALSEPVKPIVWWIENTTPVEFRPYIKAAVEKWNIAFEKAGFKNAVVCNIQPDTATWDAGDIRYNVIRWTSSPTPTFGGYGPQFSNPLTGQIMGADIMLEYVYLTNRLRLQEIFDRAGLVMNEEENYGDLSACHAGENFQFQRMFATNVMNAFDFSDIDKDELMKETIYALVLHEVGHTFGLTHNFIGSLYNTPDQMKDKSRNEQVGLSTSVMDYEPTNISPDKNHQGLYYDMKPGLYDCWAIQYGYSQFNSPEAEKVGLQAILAESVKSENRYFNDGDDMRNPGKGIDPRAMLFDHSSDPIGYAIQQLNLSDSIIAKLEEKFIKPGQSYQELRSAYLNLTGQQQRSLGVISRYIGGIFVDRNFPEQNSGNKPFTPVPIMEQKRAMEALTKFAFSKDAFTVPGDLMNYLQQQRRGFTLGGVQQDPQVLSRVLNIQKSVLDQLLHPTTLERILDSQTYGNEYKLTDEMSDLTNGIFKEDLVSNVNAKRQNLQVEYVNRLLKIQDDINQMNAVKSVALFEVNKIRKMMQSNPGNDITTKAHRANILWLIEKTLDNK